MKKKIRFSKFGIFVLVYALLFLVVIIVCDVLVYNKLETYQKSYDDAVKASEPDLFMEKFLGELDPETLMKYLEKDRSFVRSDFEDDALLRDFLEKYFASFGKLSFRRADDFNEMKPVYELLEGENIFGDIVLKRKVLTYKNMPDEYSVGEFVLGQYIDTPYMVKVVLKADERLFINGKQVEGEAFVKSKREKQVTGLEKPVTLVTYSVDGLLNEPEVKVLDGSDRVILPEDKDYSRGHYEGVEKDVADFAVPLVLDYAKFFNRNISYNDYRASILKGSMLEEIVDQVNPGLKWRDEAKTVSLTDSSVDDIFVVDADTVYAKVSLSYHMTFEKFSNNESTSYECLFVRQEGKWYIGFLGIL